MGPTERELCPKWSVAVQLARDQIIPSLRKNQAGKGPVREERRSKVVTFRLSEREHATVQSACKMDKCTISSIARRSVLAWAESLSARPKVDQRLTEIDDRLDTLYKLLNKKHES